MKHMFRSFFFVALITFPVVSHAQTVSEYDRVLPSESPARCNSLKDVNLRRCRNFQTRDYLYDQSVRYRAQDNDIIRESRELQRYANRINAGRARRTEYQRFLSFYNKTRQSREILRNEVYVPQYDRLRIDSVSRRSQLKYALAKSRQVQKRSRVQENIDALRRYQSGY